MKAAPKKAKKSKVTKLLGEQPNMKYAGANVNLTITTESITIMVMESGEVRMTSFKSDPHVYSFCTPRDACAQVLSTTMQHLYIIIQVSCHLV